MLLIFLDTETTGLDPEKHRAIEIAFKIIDSATFKIISSYESLIYQPSEIWALADPESLKIHGIAYEELLKGKREQVVASEIITYFNNAHIASKSGVFVGQNPSFDRFCFSKLIKVDLQIEYNWPYHWLDLASMYWALQLQNKKINNLKESDLSKDKIASALGLPPEKRPHRAMNGVNHLISCYEALFSLIKKA